MKPWVAFVAGAGLAAVIAVVALRKEASAPPPSPSAEVVSQPVASQEVPPTQQPAPVQPAPLTSPPVTPNRVVASAAPRPKPAQSTAPSITQASRPEPVHEQPASTTAPTQGVAPLPPPQAQQPANSEFPATRAVSEPVRPVQQKPEPHSVTIAAGTTLTIRLRETISTEKQRSGQSFAATLDQPLIVDGFVIAERGSRIDGRVVEATEPGRVKGTAHLKLELSRLHTSDGQDIPISTAAVEREGEQTRKSDAAKVAAGAGIGAALGAIFGGGKGAAIGAASGGAAGGGVVLATKGKEIVLPVESRLSFRLAAPVTITEKF